MGVDGEGQERGKIECESEGAVLVFGMLATARSVQWQEFLVTLTIRYTRAEMGGMKTLMENEGEGYTYLPQRARYFRTLGEHNHVDTLPLSRLGPRRGKFHAEHNLVNHITRTS